MTQANLKSDPLLIEIFFFFKENYPVVYFLQNQYSSSSIAFSILFCPEMWDTKGGGALEKSLAQSYQMSEK